MHHLRELQPSQLEQLNNSENWPELDSESDDGASNDDRCVASVCCYVTTAILKALEFRRITC